MNRHLLFIDGSVNPSSGVGCGTFLLVRRQDGFPDTKLLKTNFFYNTSSTQLELKTLLWALEEVGNSLNKISVITDSQNIVNLPGRREKLEKTDFISGKGKTLSNKLLYQQFYLWSDKVSFEISKVDGHLPGRDKDQIDQYFSEVDKASRRCLREKISKK